MLEAAGQRWPDGWVKGEGFVRPPDVADPMTPPPSFDKIGEEYVRQIVDLSPGQRKRYLGQLQVLARTPVRGSMVFAGPVTAISEAQLKTWLIEWDRSLKTKANYHGVHLRSRCDPVRPAVLVFTRWVLAGSAGLPDHHDRRSGFRCGEVPHEHVARLLLLAVVLSLVGSQSPRARWRSAPTR